MSHGSVHTKRRATYEDLRRVPETRVAEILDGELVVSPRPATPHAFAAAEIAADLLPVFHGTAARSGRGGWWILLEPELHLTDDVIVPDLAGWRCERMPAIPSAPAIATAPDWVCEIVSPSTARHDRVTKVRCYAREGVTSVWLVDPLARTLESLRRDRDRWTVAGSHADGETVQVEPFSDVTLRLERWWLPVPPG